MKKVFSALLISAILILAAACQNTNGGAGDVTSDGSAHATETTDQTNDGSAGDTDDNTSVPTDGMAVSDIMEKILENVENLPDSWEVELNDDNFSSYVFTDYKEGYEAICSEAMINIVPHSVVLLRVNDNTDAKSVAAEMLDKADPNKWICVSAEKVIVRQHGKTIALVMSFEEMAEQIIANFDSLNNINSSAPTESKD